jgi:hypothetical protein
LGGKNITRIFLITKKEKKNGGVNNNIQGIFLKTQFLKRHRRMNNLKIIKNRFIILS